MPDTTTTLGVLFVVCLLMVAYFPLENRLLQEDIQSMSWGPAVAQLLPIWLTAFGALFSVTIFYINAKGGLNQSRK
jgi:hypothetical protein